MAVLGRLLVGSQQRIDLPDFLSLQSYVASDFKYLIKSFIGDRALILKGFEIIDAPQSIQSNTISIKVADSVVYYPSSSAGSFFYGLPEGQALSAPLSPTLKENATNYVYVTLTTSGQGQDTRAFWDVDLNGGEGGEFNQDINTEGVLVAQAGVSTSGFPDGTVPIAIVDMGVAAINKITDARNLMFRLGSGGVSPNSNATFQFPPLPSAEYARNEPPSTIQSAASDNPFFGGDKNIQSLKDWMDAVMTKLLELSGTTYWYETTQALNLVNIFDDALGSSVKSKGRWNHDESQPGIITWSEDIVYRKMNDRRDILIKANPNDGVQLQNEQVMWIQLERNQPVNPLDTPLKFLQNTAYIDADQAGSFSNINIGDWIKRRGDNENLYVRVKGFLDSDGLIATPSTATRAVLENAYQGAEATESAVYTKGVYSNADIKVNNRNDVAAYASGGDFYWLANRSDTVMSIQSISHQLVAGVQVVEADGKKAKLRFTSSHGLVDGDRIVVADAPAYNGTYQIDKISDTEISIETTGTGSATAVVSWAIVTTKSTEIGIAGSPDQLEIESANHGFSSNQTISISGTGVSAYDTYDGGGGGAGKYLINTRTNTQFQIPFYNSTAVNAAAGDATCAKVILKTEFGAIEVIQGESIDINQPDAVNIMQFVGMESISQTAPNYFLSASYNALQGTANFNSSDNDNLTTRAAKLTAMMADRVQDRDAQIVGRITVRNEASGLQQFISVSGGPIDLLLPGTGRCEVTFPSSFYLDSYKAVTATFNRNETNQIVSVNTSENLDDLALESYKYNLNENKIVLFYRLNGTEIYTWDGSAILNSSSWTSNDFETSQNKNIIVKDEAGVVFNPDENKINYTSVSGFVKIIIPGSDVDNHLDVGALRFESLFTAQGILVNDGQSVWVRINRSADKTFNKLTNLATYQDTNANGAVYITDTKDVPTDQDAIVLYSVNNDTLVKHHHHFDIGNIYEEHSILMDPISSGSIITLPADTRNFNLSKQYIVGSGQLEVFLNGQRLRNTEDYQETGTILSPSSGIQILSDLVVDDVLTFRISGSGGIYTAPAGYSTSTLQQIYDNSSTLNYEILTTSSYPLRIAAPSASHKTPLSSNVALSIAGDLAVSGVIDPTAITFIPQVSSPLGLGESGVWIDSNQNLRFDSTNPSKSINVNQTIDIIEQNIGTISNNIANINQNINSINNDIESANSRLTQIETDLSSSTPTQSNASVNNSFEFINNSGSNIVSGNVVRIEEITIPGEYIDSGEPFNIVSSQELSNYEQELKSEGVNIRVGQTFTLTDNKEINKISVKLNKYGNITGNYTVEIYQPSGSNIWSLNLGLPIATSQPLDVSILTDTFNWHDFTFSQPISLNQNTRYAFYLKSNNLITSGFSSISIRYSATDRIATEVMLLEGSSLESDVTYRIYGRNISQNTTPPTIIQSLQLASASSISNAIKTVGVVQGLTAQNGQTCTVHTNGVITLPGNTLSVGSLVYLSDTVSGSVTTTKPTAYGSVVLSLGVAIAANKFVLNPKLLALNILPYEETYTAPSNISTGSTLTLPLDSKAANSVRKYVVGGNGLTVYHNGQKLYKNINYQEVGSSGTESNQIVINKNIATNDIIEYRIEVEHGLVSALSLV